MNKQESDILNVILQYHCRNQRALAERCGFSLGMVNRSVKALQGQGFLTTDMELTEKARLEMAKHRPKNAVILAAGYGMRNMQKSGCVHFRQCRSIQTVYTPAA